MKLIPKSVTISTSIKSFGHMDGVSTGSFLSMEVDVPDGLTVKELQQEMAKAKLWLDLQCIDLEGKRGVMPTEIVNHLKWKLVEAAKAEAEKNGNI